MEVDSDEGIAYGNGSEEDLTNGCHDHKDLNGHGDHKESNGSVSPTTSIIEGRGPIPRKCDCSLNKMTLV